ncbi:MAG: [acyl-carrier-protein] S-malonyltransferase [Acidobacteria bacterium]|nr:MAG: [acyl-carrier-protein] S-malonyltransferase [Acidobacteriota bacterium]
MNPSAKIAFIFPGQASQYPGMGKELYDEFKVARLVFEETDQILGFPLSQLCFNGPEEELRLTENTQPALLTVSIAAFRVLSSKGVLPHFVAGHSLGEYSALVAAESLSLSDAVTTVRNRGKYMQEAVPRGQGAMAAILGLDQDRVQDLCEEVARDEVLATANLNSPVQIVIAGTEAAVLRGMELARARGAKKTILLPVSAPFHCPLMQPAQERLRNDLAQIQFRDLQFPLINNADAAEISSGDDIMDSLIRQVSSPVRWTESVRLMITKGVGLFVEVGPGRVLSGLVRQIDKRVKTSNVEDVKSLNETLELVEPLE